MKFGLITRMLGALAALIIVSPLIALLSKTPWSKFFSSFSDFDAIRLSIWTSTLAALISLTLGVPLAYLS